MCTTCGCGDTELVPVELHEKILAGNDRTARHNRALAVLGISAAAELERILGRRIS